MTNSQEINDSVRKKPPLLLVFLLPVIGIIFSLLAVEIVFRLALSKGGPPKWDDRPKPYFVPEDAKTFQDYPYQAKKPEGVFRVAVIGDSFTFAPYMQFDDAFPKRIERYLNLNRTQTKVEVINYGVPRYSTSHEIKTTRQALEEGADLVILQITLNDPEIKLDWPTGLQLDTQSGEVKLAHPIYRYWKTLAYVRTRIENTRSHREYRDYFYRLFDKKDNWNSFSDSMRTLVSACRERNVPIVAAVFPLFGYPVDEQYPFFPIHERVAKLLESLQVIHTDLTESYRNIPLDRLQVLPGVDRHPNEIAHRIAAEQILAFLKDKSLLPAGVFPAKSVDLRVGLFAVKK
jgi:hypothetical protein